MVTLFAYLVDKKTHCSLVSPWSSSWDSVFSAGPWEMRLQRSLTTKKVLSFCRNCPKRILRSYANLVSYSIKSKIPCRLSFWFLLQLVHTLSVSLNKVGDLRYYDGDLQSARSYYARSLDVRRNSVKEHSAVASQVIAMLTCCRVVH